MMAEVKIPFHPFFRKPFWSGQKVMTCRTKRMGNPGDTFTAYDAKFVLTHVFRARLGYIIADCFEQEGCQSVQELTEIWQSIHPVKGVDPEEIVWAHCFRKI